MVLVRAAELKSRLFPAADIDLFVLFYDFRKPIMLAYREFTEDENDN